MAIDSFRKTLSDVTESRTPLLILGAVSSIVLALALYQNTIDDQFLDVLCLPPEGILGLGFNVSAYLILASLFLFLSGLAGLVSKKFGWGTLILLTGLLLIIAIFSDRSGGNREPLWSARCSEIAYFPPIELSPSYAADFSNDRFLMGASHNVFVGKVLRQTGTKERGIGPETQFEVEVVTLIKGDVEGIVMVNQQGGVKDDFLYIMEGGDAVIPRDDENYFLQSGSTYLLATRYNDQEKWHTLISHPNARKLISRDNLDTAELKVMAEADERVGALKTAYPNEILLQVDVESANAKNSYRSLRFESTR